jgi:ADP-heptose:LPS heptosyltransferase
MVVSVDTGLLHISVHQGVDTIGLYRQLPVYVRDFANSVKLISPIACAQACRNIEMDKAHHTKPKAGKDFVPADWACVAAIGWQCMEAISAAQVFQAVSSVVLQSAPEDSST